MKRFFFLSLFITFSSFSSEEVTCIESPYPETDINVYNQVLVKHFRLPYYLYFEGNKIEDLQALKNCIDYSKCGKNHESIVDDPKNYRLHIWDNFTQNELQDLINSCSIPNLNSKLIIRETNENGRRIYMNKSLHDSYLLSASFKSRSNPAVFKKISEKEANEAIKKITMLIKNKKHKEATDLILKTWEINPHGYSISFTGKAGGYATANHSTKKIEYGSDWLKNTCDFVRMIRHEAEHVTQMRQAKACNGNHNFSDHKMRERAAHLNDALFIPTVCPNTPQAESIRNFCVKRFKTNYFNN